jgi:hypothetical protein
MMKKVIYILCFIVLTACENKQVNNETQNNNKANLQSQPIENNSNEIVDSGSIKTENKLNKIDTLKERTKTEQFDLKSLNIGEKFKGGIVIKKTMNSVLICSRKPLGAGSYDECARICKNYKSDGLKWRIPSPEELVLIFSLKSYLDNYESNWYWTNSTNGNTAMHIGIQQGDHMFVPKEHGKFVIAVAQFESE